MDIENINTENIEFYKTIFSKIGIGVFIIDLRSNEYVWGNNLYTDILGYSTEEFFKNSMEFAEKYFHPDDKDLARSRILAFKENVINTWAGVYRVKHKEGHWVWVYSHFNVFQRDSSGLPAQLIGVSMDAAKHFKTKDQIDVLYNERLRSRKQELINKLTKRQIEIIRLIAQGQSYTEIARNLSIQPDTVNKHRKNILHILGLNNIASLVCFAKEVGLA